MASRSNSFSTRVRFRAYGYHDFSCLALLICSSLSKMLSAEGPTKQEIIHTKLLDLDHLGKVTIEMAEIMNIKALSIEDFEGEKM